MASFLVDVRSTEEYATGFLPGAVNIPHTEIHQLRRVFPDIQHDSMITLYCRSGRRTVLAETVLREMGFTNVRDLGGMQQAIDILASEAAGIPPPLDHTASGEPAFGAPRSRGSHPYSKQYLQSTADDLLAAMRALENPEAM